MRRFVIDSRGAAATVAAPHAYGIQWPDGIVTVRMRLDLREMPVHFMNIAGLLETCNAEPRWLDPAEDELPREYAEMRARSFALRTSIQPGECMVAYGDFDGTFALRFVRKPEEWG